VFKKVLELNPPREQKVTSLKGIASLYFNMKKLDQAKQYHRMVIDLDRTIRRPITPLALIDWTRRTSRAWKSAPNWG